MLLTAELRRYDVYTEIWKRMELWKTKDGIIWIMPPVTNNSDTPGFVFCCHLTIKRMEYIPFHLIGADGCNTVQHHLQVIVLPSHWHTVYITCLFCLACIYFTKMPQRQQWCIKSYYREKWGIPTCSIFYDSKSHKAFGLSSQSPTEQTFQCGKAENMLGCPSHLLCSICF